MGELTVAKKKQDGEVNKSQAIRDLLKENPEIKAGDAIAQLADKGVEIKSGLFYLVKGKTIGSRKRRRKVQRNAVAVAVSSGSTDAVATILKVRKLAQEVGGLRKLAAIVEALNG